MTAGVLGLSLLSFLMATAHGAGLMLAAVMFKQLPRMHDAAVPGSASLALAAAIVHTLAMAATAAIVAFAI